MERIHWEIQCYTVKYKSNRKTDLIGSIAYRNKFITNSGFCCFFLYKDIHYDCFLFSLWIGFFFFFLNLG